MLSELLFTFPVISPLDLFLNHLLVCSSLPMMLVCGVLHVTAVTPICECTGDCITINNRSLYSQGQLPPPPPSPPPPTPPPPGGHRFNSHSILLLVDTHTSSMQLLTVS